MVQISEDNYRRRYEEYKNDTFIKGCTKAIEEVITKSQSYVMLSPQFGTTEYDTDLQSKERIAFWKNQIDIHIKKRYPDLIHQGLFMNANSK